MKKQSKLLGISQLVILLDIRSLDRNTAFTGLIIDEIGFIY